MQATTDVRYPETLRVRIPQEISDAVDAAARARFMSCSEYVRQALLKSLSGDDHAVEILGRATLLSQIRGGVLTDCRSARHVADCQSAHHCSYSSTRLGT